MSHIVCGRFDRTVDADAALEALKSEGFRREEVTQVVPRTYLRSTVAPVPWVAAPGSSEESG